LAKSKAEVKLKKRKKTATMKKVAQKKESTGS